MKTTKIILGLAFALLIFSCSKQDNNTDNSAITSDEATINAKIDIASDDVSNIVEEQHALTYSNSLEGRSINAKGPQTTYPQISRVPDFGTMPTVGQTVTKTIDFGPDGVVLPSGFTVKGIIVISFIFNPSATTHTITYTFQNFYHNNIKFDGTKTFTISMSVASGNNLAHPIVLMNMDFTATFPNGNIYTRVGTRTTEFIEGYYTPQVWSDNQYQVTGSWTTTYPNTTVQTSTITTPLLLKMSCASLTIPKPIIVSGIITFQRNNHTATLDYGNGACDNLAVFTINGVSFNIIIGN